MFNAEPAPAEVLEFVQYRMSCLLERASVAMPVDALEPRAINPKRAARAALALRGSSTQSQEALRLELEQNKQIRKQRGRAEREADAGHKRQLKLAKAKAAPSGQLTQWQDDKLRSSALSSCHLAMQD